MSKETIIKLLSELISREEDRLISSCPQDNIGKKAFLYSLMRGFDTYHLFTKDGDKYVHYYEFGWLKALRLAYGSYVNEERYPLFKAEEKLLSLAHWFVIRSGEIEFCRKVIDFLKAGLGEASIAGKQITVEFRNAGVEEEFDNHSYHWVHNLVDQNVCEPEIKKILQDVEGIRKTMRGLVDKWRKHYIQYDTTPEIDNIFEKFAYYKLFSSEEKDEFSPNAIFGGITYSKYCEYVGAVCAIALKHYHFCLELYDKYRGEISFPDIISVTKDCKNFILSMSNYLGVTEAQSEQMLNAITILPENIDYHSGRLRSSPPPFVKIADNSLIQSIVGSQVNPYNFLNHELRRRYEKDYFKSVNEREKTFRDQLYMLFEDENYLKLNKNITFQSSKGNSDIDAAIYDRNANVLGLFQLKWQEKYGASMKERYSRISNLYPKINEWIDKVEAWVSESKARDVMRHFGIDYSGAEPVKVLLFVACRHATFFTGYEPDKRASWASIWLILKVLMRIPKEINNKLEVLHNLLFQEYLVILKGKKNQSDEDVFSIGEYEIHLKTVC